MFWKGRNIVLLGDSNGKTYLKGEILDKAKAKRDWNMEEGEKKWKIIQDDRNLKITTM